MFTKLQNLYWHIRNTRNLSKKRKLYRYVEKEKKRLIEELGFDSEEVRLMCRALSKSHCEHAERNLKNYREQLRQLISVFALFY